MIGLGSDKNTLTNLVHSLSVPYALGIIWFKRRLTENWPWRKYFWLIVDLASEGGGYCSIRGGWKMIDDDRREGRHHSGGANYALGCWCRGCTTACSPQQLFFKLSAPPTFPPTDPPTAPPIGHWLSLPCVIFNRLHHRLNLDRAENHLQIFARGNCCFNFQQNFCRSFTFKPGTKIIWKFWMSYESWY